MYSPKVSRLPQVLIVLPFCFVFFIAGALFASYILASHAGSNPQTAGGPQREVSKGDEPKKAPIADDLKWVLAMILGSTGLFALTQGALAFFTAQTFVKQAEDSIKHLQGIAAEVEDNYPVYANVERSRKKAYLRLDQLFGGEGLDWPENLYGRLDATDRQLVISVESFVGVEFTGRSARGTEFAKDLRRLANFHHAKYVHEGKADRDDLERAEYYLKLALDATDEVFYLLNDLGHVQVARLQGPLPAGSTPLSDNEREKLLASCRDLFERSLHKNSLQQRAHYNLSVLASMAASPNWKEIEKRLTDAKELELWEREPSPERKCDLLYNLACAQARQGDDQAIRRCFLTFEELLTLAKEHRIVAVREKTWSQDLLAKGDLHALSHHKDERIRERFKAIAQRVAATRT